MRAAEATPTQAQLDAAYAAGRDAARRDYGTHGPTVRRIPHRRTANPEAGLRAEAWARGYAQDVRRVLAGAA
jgi:hypothetical protein